MRLKHFVSKYMGMSYIKSYVIEVRDFEYGANSGLEVVMTTWVVITMEIIYGQSTIFAARGMLYVYLKII